MLLTELHGLETCFLHMLVASGGGAENPQPLVLQPYLENRLLQFQTLREASTGCEVQVLQAGHPHGLMAYLFTLYVPRGPSLSASLCCRYLWAGLHNNVPD